MIGFWAGILMTVTWKESVKVAPLGIVPIGKATREFTFCKTPFSVTVPGVNIVPFGSDLLVVRSLQLYFHCLR